MSYLASLVMLDAWLAWQQLEPQPGPEVSIQPTTVSYVETRNTETVLRRRPWVPNRRVATLGEGTRLVVRGQVESRDKKGCRGQPWYAIAPFGFVCSLDVKTTRKPPSLKKALPVPKGKRLPHRYAFVSHDGTPMFRNAEAVATGEVERPLKKRMSLIVDDYVTIQGTRYLRTARGRLVDADLVRGGGQGSAFGGVSLHQADAGNGPRLGLSFGWARGRKREIRSAPSHRAPLVGIAEKRSRVPIFASEGKGRQRFLKIGEDMWIASSEVNEVEIVEPPASVQLRMQRQAKWLAKGELAGNWAAEEKPLYTATVEDEPPLPPPERADAPLLVPPNIQWFDVNVGEQTLVAYRGRTPVFATMVSSGRKHATPLGDYPVWAKVASMSMANQAYEDDAYLVQGVPWVLLFQAHNAFHGAYWHDGFGQRKSHGCVNLSPLDARWVFQWSGPRLAEGWTGYLPDHLEESPIVHVRDPDKRRPFLQERPPGPPNRELERKLREEADLRRAEEAELAAANADPNANSLGIPTFIGRGSVRTAPAFGGGPKPQPPGSPQR